MDAAHDWTDKEILNIQRYLNRFYSRARKNIEKVWDPFVTSVKKRSAEIMEEYENAEDQNQKQKAKQKYIAYFRSVVSSSAFLALQKKTSRIMYEANAQSAAYINLRSPAVYARNYNDIGASLAKDLKGYSFKKITEKEAAEFSGIERQKVDEKKDRAWNEKSIRRAILTGSLLLLVGGKLFGRAFDNLVGKNRDSAHRQASDMMTGAENSGRLDSMYRAYDEGFSVKKYWIATLDNRTRDTHIEYDSMDPVDLDYEYNYGLKIPKDSHCSIMEEVCNCRCRILYDTGRGKSSTRTAREGEVTGSYKNPSSFDDTKTINVSQMTYKEWIKWRSR